MNKNLPNGQNCKEIKSPKEQFSSFAEFLFAKMNKYCIARADLDKSFGFSDYQIKKITDKNNNWKGYTIPKIRLIIRCCCIFVDTSDELEYLLDRILGFKFLGNVPSFKQWNYILDCLPALYEMTNNSENIPIDSSPDEKRNFLINRAYKREILLKDIINIFT